MLIDTAFSFLPALVTYSVMKKFGGSPALGIVIGLMLVAPQLPNANQVAGGTAEPILLSLGALSIPIVGYQGSVLPALVLGILAAKIEKALKKVVPDVLDLIVTPFVTLLCSLVIGLLVIGPIMHEVEQVLLIAVQALMNIPFGIGGFLVGALQQVVVITGLHHTFKTLEIELLANTGANPFNTLTCGAIVAQCGAAVAAALKLKNKKQKSLYLSEVLPASLGITEPLIFGGNLPRLTPFVCACIGGGAAGVFSSIMGLAATGLGINAVVSNMSGSQYPVLFIVSLALGSLLGTILNIDGKFQGLMGRLGKSELGKGLSTGILLYCIGSLSILGPMQSALYGDHTYLFTNATLDFVTSTVLASTYGIGMALAAPVLFCWQGAIYLGATYLQSFLTDSLMAEITIVGGFLIAASGLSILNLKDCKTLNMLPALVVPVLFFLILKVVSGI